MVEISAVLFDVGGVLLTNGGTMRSALRFWGRFSLDRAAYEERHELANDAWERGFMSARQFLARTVFFEPRSFTPEEFLEEVKMQSRVLPSGALETVRALRASGKVQLVVLNNEARELNDYRIERFELRKYFHAFLSSCYLGLRKPDPAIFLLALDVLGQRPEEVAFVDDRQQNCDAAKSLGVHAIVYQDQTQLEQELGHLGILDGSKKWTAPVASIATGS